MAYIVVSSAALGPYPCYGYGPNAFPDNVLFPASYPNTKKCVAPPMLRTVQRIFHSPIWMMLDRLLTIARVTQGLFMV